MKGAGLDKKKWHEKIGTASVKEGWEESGKSERMGRDGKLTRSLLLGALGAENKEREGGDRESSVGDRLVGATRHFVRPFQQSTIYLSDYYDKSIISND